MATRLSMQEAKRGSAPTFKGEDIIEVSRIEPNQLNPRPPFHFGANNPDILKLADSIRVDGLHNPLKVYEIANKPGYYRIVQGHRRHLAATVGAVEWLECIILEAPQSLSEELMMLGSEDANKQPWGTLYQLKFAYDLSKEYGYATPAHPDIQLKTGLSLRQLGMAEKIFHLDDSILGMLAEYEQLKYETSLSGERRGGRLGKVHGLNTLEFSIEKAALVYDLCEALKIHYNAAIRDLSEAELQFALAQVMSKTTLDDGTNFLNQIKATGQNPRPGVLSRIHQIISDPAKAGSIKGFLRHTGSQHASRFAVAMKQANVLEQKFLVLARRVDQVGDDPDLLKEANITLLRLERTTSELQKKIDTAMRSALKGH